MTAQPDNTRDEQPKEIFFKKDLPTVLDNQQAAQPTIDSEVDRFLTKFYEDSVDAYHAFMGTYTDAEADNEAPDRLIEAAAQAITNLIAQEANKAVISELAKLTNHDNYISDAHLGQVVSVKTIENRIKGLTADKESSPNE